MVCESLASKKTKNKAVLRQLLLLLQQPDEGTPALPTATAFAFAREIICFEQGRFLIVCVCVCVRACVCVCVCVYLHTHTL